MGFLFFPMITMGLGLAALRAAGAPLQIISLYCTHSWREMARVSFLPFVVNVMLNLTNVMLNLSNVPFMPTPRSLMASRQTEWNLCTRIAHTSTREAGFRIIYPLPVCITFSFTCEGKECLNNKIFIYRRLHYVWMGPWYFVWFFSFLLENEIKNSKPRCQNRFPEFVTNLFPFRIILKIMGDNSRRVSFLSMLTHGIKNWRKNYNVQGLVKFS